MDFGEFDPVKKANRAARLEKEEGERRKRISESLRGKVFENVSKQPAHRVREKTWASPVREGQHDTRKEITGLDKDTRVTVTMFFPTSASDTALPHYVHILQRNEKDKSKTDNIEITEDGVKINGYDMLDPELDDIALGVPGNAQSMEEQLLEMVDSITAQDSDIKWEVALD